MQDITHLPMGLMWQMPIPVACSLAVAAKGLAVSCGQCPLDTKGQVLHPGDARAQAGLVAGLHAINSPIKLLGIGTRAPREKQETMVHDLACRTAEHMGMRGGIPREAVVANCDYVGGGYGVPTPGMVEAVTMVARLEGILLDPVYSGKAMAGLIDLIRKGQFTKGQNIVFLHTGGAVGLFGYVHGWAERLGL